MTGAEIMLEEFMKNHVAVSSLESSDHAVRKDPKIITVTWFIGKRCNYDCSYCAPYLHDNYSPHILKQDAFNFIDQLEKYTLQQNKKFKISITVGEPFVHPQFFEILEYIKKKETLTQLSAVSNGSLPLDNYIKSSMYLTNITISLHLEQIDSITNKTIDKIIELNKIESWFLNVNLMAFPGKFKIVKDTIEIFKKNNIKFVLRKINPPINNPKDKINKGDIERILSEKKSFMTDKIKKKLSYTENLEIRYKSYYSTEELNFLSTHENNEQWQNIKLYSPTENIEKNTDELIAKNLNSWKGWQCYIGIDSLYIQHNGMVFRGNCLQGGSIGKLGEKINWPKNPIVCPINWCTCNADMVVRKVKNTTYNKLIND